MAFRIGISDADETYQLLGEGRHNGRESRGHRARADAELANDGRKAFDAAYENL